MLYRLLTGGYTHSFSLEPDEMRRQLLDEPPLSFARHDVHGLPSVERVLARALSKDPIDRFASDRRDAAPRTGRPSGRTWLVRRPLRGGRTGSERARAGDEADRFVADVLERLSPSGPLLASDLEPPRASVNLGAAGIAYGILRMAMARDDERLLALADLWSVKAMAGLGTREAFVNEALEITPKDFGTTGLHHSATGVYVIEASIANARGDRDGARRRDRGNPGARWRRRPRARRLVRAQRDAARAGDAARRAAERRASNGRTLIELGQPPGRRRVGGAVGDGIADAGDPGPTTPRPRSVSRCGARLDRVPVRAASLGRERAGRPAAGRTLAWPSWSGWRCPWGAASSGLVRPGPADDGALAATWCNGAAGMIPLWTLAARMLGRGSVTWRLPKARPGPPTRVTRHRATCAAVSPVEPTACSTCTAPAADPIWLARARDLAEQAVPQVRENALRRDSLYKGEIGVAALLVDLERPDDAAMPFYDREP